MFSFFVHLQCETIFLLLDINTYNLTVCSTPISTDIEDGDRIGNIAQVEPEDVKKAAKEYLQIGKRVTGVLKPLGGNDD